MGDTTQNLTFQNDSPIPVTLVDKSGNAITNANQLPTTGGSGGGATDVTIHDPTTTSQKLAVDASGKIGINNTSFTANAGTNLNTSQLALESGGNLAAAKTDLDTIVTNTTGLATQTTLASAKTDLDTIVTNTGRIPAQGAAATSASTPVNIASDQIVPVKASFTELTGSASALNADLIASTDVSAYRHFSLQITTSFSGTVSIQGSNDNTNWQTVYSNPVTSLNGILVAITGANIYEGPVRFRYMRVRMTSYTSGTASAVLELYTTSNTALTGYMLAGQSGTWTMQPGNTPNTSAWLFNSVATSGGTSAYHRISTADNNAVSIKASGGQIYGYEIFNSNAAVRYVKLYNKASAPNPASDTVFRTIGVPAGGRASGSWQNGIAMGTGIALAAVTGISDTDNTAVGAGDLSIEIDYK